VVGVVDQQEQVVVEEVEEPVGIVHLFLEEHK
jgi:hypothetical protein